MFGTPYESTADQKYTCADQQMPSELLAAKPRLFVKAYRLHLLVIFELENLDVRSLSGGEVKRATSCCGWKYEIRYQRRCQRLRAFKEASRSIAEIHHRTFALRRNVFRMEGQRQPALGREQRELVIGAR